MKKPLVELIESWLEFEDRYPGQGIDAFCHYMSEVSHRTSAKHEDRDVQIARFARVIGRLSSVYGLYHRAAMENAGLPGQESFFFLNVLNQLGEVNKSELIHYLLVENTTGMEGINKLIKAGLVRERPDPDDKRAKLIRISEKGSQKLKSTMPNARRVNEMVFKDLDADALSVCLQILEPIEVYHTRKSVEIRQLPFNEMADDVLKKQ
jgi:DNA-binding MarR family transcriptional regulator